MNRKKMLPLVLLAAGFVYQHTKIRDILKMLQHQKSHIA